MSHNFNAKNRRTLPLWSGGFKDNVSKSEAETNSGPHVRALFFEWPLFACTEHTQS